MQQLKPNTTLQGGKYRIERVLGQGGFGITYLARNTVFDIDVAIKEFFMKDENDRDGSSVTMLNTTKQELFHGQMEKFRKEAKRMFAIKNEHIIGVHDLFEENGTTYYVMDYVDGDNLAERLKRTGKPMTEKEVSAILPQILDALKSVHDAGIWHLDLKPANIMMDKNGCIKLIDFGASKQFNVQKGGATTSTAISYTNSYAPREQMEQNYDKFGPWTDIYALGATLYTMLTNKRPPLPTDIDDDISEDKHLALPMPAEVMGSKLHKLILLMLSTNRNHRPQSVNDITNHMLLYDNDIEDTILESPKDSVQEIDYSNEETIIATPDIKETKKEEKVITDNKTVKKQATSPKVESRTHEEKNPSKDNNEGNGIGILIGMGLIIGFIILLAVNSGKCSNSNSYSSQSSEPMDSIVEDNGGEVVRKPIKNGKVIERNVDGIILGASTKEDVIKNLKAKNKSYDIHEPSDNYSVIISNGSFSYKGVDWQAVMYKLYENRVFVVVYIKGVNRDKANSLIITAAKLNRLFADTYKNYQIKTRSGLYQYQDTNSFITIELGENFDELSLGFGDVKLSKFLTN